MLLAKIILLYLFFMIKVEYYKINSLNRIKI